MEWTNGITWLPNLMAKLLLQRWNHFQLSFMLITWLLHISIGMFTMWACLDPPIALVKHLLDIIEELFLVPSVLSVGGAWQNLAGFGSLVDQWGETAGEHGLSYQRHRDPVVQSRDSGPLASTFLSSTVPDLLHQECSCTPTLVSNKKVTVEISWLTMMTKRQQEYFKMWARIVCILSKLWV